MIHSGENYFVLFKAWASLKIRLYSPNTVACDSIRCSFVHVARSNLPPQPLQAVRAPLLLMTDCFCLIQYSPLATGMASHSVRRQNGQQPGLSHVIFLKHIPRNEMTSFKMLSSAQGKYFFIKQKCMSSSFYSNYSLKYVTWKLQLQNNWIPNIFPL